jgi:hypothetical protein
MDDDQLKKYKEVLKGFLEVFKGFDAIRPRDNIAETKKIYEVKITESPIISSSTKLNKYISILLDYAKINDFFGVENTIKNIEIESTKIYYDTDNVRLEIKKILNKIHNANIHYTNPDWRFEKLINLYTDLRLILDKTKKHGTLKQILKNLFFDMQNSFNSAFSDIDSLCEFRNQANQIFLYDYRVKKELFRDYKKYVTMQKKLAGALPHLIRLQPVEKDGKIMYHKNGINKISEEFKDFFSSFADFITSIEDQSNEDTKKKIDKKTCKNNHRMLDKKWKSENLL